MGEDLMSALIPASGVFALMFALPAAQAQTISAAVEPGLKVSVTDQRGATVEGRVQEVSDRFVRLSVAGRVRDIPVEEVVRIERPDTVKNGALIGFAVGVGSGLVAVAFDPHGGAVLVSRTVGNGVVCAGLGALIDAAIDSRRTLYERGSGPQTRLHPVIGRHVRGVAATVAW
jgi:hypothetical protein